MDMSGAERVPSRARRRTGMPRRGRRRETDMGDQSPGRVGTVGVGRLPGWGGEGASGGFRREVGGGGADRGRGVPIRPASAEEREFLAAPATVETFISMWLKGDRVCLESLTALDQVPGTLPTVRAFCQG